MLVKLNKKIDNIYPIYLANGAEEFDVKNISEDFAYIIGKSGLYLFQRNFLMESVCKVHTLLGNILDVKEQTQLKIASRIDKSLFKKIIFFFKKVYNEYKQEAVGILVYNQKENNWEFCVPKQSGSLASVKYEGIDKPSEDYVVIGSVHSHSNFSAFHSGIDKKDEEFFDGIHITIGNLDKPVQDFSCEIVHGKNRTKIAVSQVVETDDEQKYNIEDWFKKVQKEPSLMTSTNYPQSTKGSPYYYPYDKTKTEKIDKKNSGGKYNTNQPIPGLSNVNNLEDINDYYGFNGWFNQ